MKEGICGKRLGLTVGLFAALIHAVWAIGVASGMMQRYMDWILALHFIRNPYVILDFDVGSAILLVVMAFVGGYVFGYILAAIWNWTRKMTK